MSPFSQVADYIIEHVDWITKSWVEAIRHQPDIHSAESLTYRQIVDHLPYLCHDLADRLRAAGVQPTPAEAQHARTHGVHRWEQGYKLDELIRESGILRHVFVVECLDAFRRTVPEFDMQSRTELATVIHRFFDDMLMKSAQQFAKEQESGLIASRQNTQGILESALDSIVVMGEDGFVREWNPAAERMFGYKREEVIGKELASLIIPEELRDRHRLGLAHYLKSGEGPLLGQRIEVEAIGARGKRLLVELAITPARIDEKAVFTAYLRDITERVQTERRREAQYAIASLLAGDVPLSETAPAILETVAKSGAWVFSALWLADADGQLKCYTTWQADGAGAENFAAETMSRTLKRGEGVPGSVLLSGKPVWIADAARQEEFTRRREAAASDLHGVLVFPLTGSSGRNGVIEILSHSILSPDEDLLRLVDSLGIQVGLYLERKQTEEELHRQKEAAEAANMAKDRFLAALSHELRTPLTPVLMWACVASGDETLDPSMREDVRMVCRNIELEARLIDDLLDLTRITQGKLQLKLQKCDAHLLLEHALEIVRSQITAKRIQLELDLTASNHRIEGDPTRIQQVFWNLLKNAQKFTPEGGRISVRSFDSAPDVLAFEISDTGRGIDPDLMPRLFTAFQQGAPSGEGLGLGLAICRAVVEMHGGKISARSNGAGQGA
ncbi:MAG: PAS domain S-box protein, partial [Verrucomicrobiota bacterium]|nr:PAS domain S-box protein [Verrucomicrobiota bacterium]